MLHTQSYAYLFQTFCHNLSNEFKIFPVITHSRKMDLSHHPRQSTPATSKLFSYAKRPKTDNFFSIIHGSKKPGSVPSPPPPPSLSLSLSPPLLRIFLFSVTYLRGVYTSPCRPANFPKATCSRIMEIQGSAFVSTRSFRNEPSRRCIMPAPSTPIQI